MSVWVLRTDIAQEQEAEFIKQDFISLPFEGIPDLSAVRSLAQCKALIKALHPSAPPEQIQGQAEKLWSIYNNLEEDDTLAVYLPASKTVRLARLTGKYKYIVGEDGKDQHRMGITWYWHRPIALLRFGRNKELFVDGKQPLVQVKDKKQAAAITDRLPYNYNRFKRIKWLLVVLVVLKVISVILRSLSEKS
jgi:hypothetical protein